MGSSELSLSRKTLGKGTPLGLITCSGLPRSTPEYHGLPTHKALSCESVDIPETQPQPRQGVTRPFMPTVGLNMGLLSLVLGLRVYKTLNPKP